MKTYTTSKGITVEFLNCQTLLDKLRTSRKVIDPPTYTVKTMTGASEIHAHDKTTIRNEAEKADWETYQNAKLLADLEYSQALLKLCLLRGIKYPEPVDDAWAKEQAYLGITVPTDPIEKRLHYITTEVLETQDAVDAENIMLGVFEASQVPAEVLSRMADSFRGSVGKSERDETDRPEHTDDGAGVVLQSEIRGSENGGQGGDDGKHIRRARRK